MALLLCSHSRAPSRQSQARSIRRPGINHTRDEEQRFDPPVHIPGNNGVD
jgi:hypothetical protein